MQQMCWRIALSLLVFTCPSVAQTGTLLFKGVRYEHRTESDPPLSIHLVEVDPVLTRIVAARALNSGVGRETVSSIARRRGARVAINGGFFATGGRYDGDPVGPLRIDQHWFSDSSLGRGAIGWDDSGQVRIDRISARWYIEIGGVRAFFQGLNESRDPDAAVLYNWDFHRSTLTDPGGTEWIISDGVITAISQSGDSPIPVGGYVASFGPKATVSKTFPGVAKGTQVHLGTWITSARQGPDSQKVWQGLGYIVGGTPLLISAGTRLLDYAAENVRQSFIEDRHPRTAVCIQSNQHWLFVVADGRQPKLSRGMTLEEMTDLMLAEGCQDALNLDGGGSSTLVIDGQLRNSPSDFGVERPVSDAILVFPRKP